MFRNFVLAGSGLVVVIAAWHADEYRQANAAPPQNAAGEQDVEKSLAEELPRISAVEPADALATFEVAQGFSLELVASEPLVSDPVDACFDEFGRMFVAEMHGYPFSQEPTRLNPKGGGKQDAGIIRLLEDTDDDGRMDRSSVYADGIRWPTSVCCWKGGVFVLAPPKLWYFRDSDSDGVADERRVIYDGFDRGNVQSVANNLKWGLDGRIYGAGGRNPSVLSRDGKEVLKLGRTDFSFDPTTLEVRAETGGVQYGHSFDDRGNRFVCSNSNHIQQVVFPFDALNRNPAWQVKGAIRSIAAGGAAAPVFRRSPAEPWRIVRTRRRVADPKYARLPPTERVPIGFFTSATGVTIYRGDAWPDEYRGQAFIGDVGGNLIHRKTMTREADQVVFVAKRADEGREFIASTDNWFRPVNFVNAPDGTLYALDMYRETIEHPYSIPEDIKGHLDLESGDDRGRIYRIVGPNGKRNRVDQLRELNVDQLVSRLESRNAWTRETAQRLIRERQPAEAASRLKELVRHSDQPLARLHALYCLEGLGSLNLDDVIRGIADADASVRRHAVRLGSSLLNENVSLIESISRLAADPDHSVRFELALAVSKADRADRLNVLASILSRAGSNSEVRSAAMTSVADAFPQLIAEILSQPDTNRQLTASDAGARAFRSWLLDAVRSVGTLQDPGAILTLIPAVTGEIQPVQSQLDLLLALNSGLNQRGSSLQSWMKSSSDRKAVMKLMVVVGICNQLTTDRQFHMPSRIQLIPSLTLAEEDSARKSLEQLLTPEEPQSIQLAAVSALADHRGDGLTDLLLDRWRSFSPSVRQAATSALTRTVTRARQLLDAVENGTVRSSEIAVQQKQLLTGHPNAKIKSRAQALFESAQTSDRAAVVRQYEAALELKADPAAGRALFMKKCSVCHRVEKIGHAVGPDIVSVQNKSPADLLIAIMDPNREAQPNFTAYSIVTQSGQVYNGIVAAESSTTITLKRAEGKEDTINRSEIEQMVSSGRTLMPDGLEKEFKPQDIANIIGFIKSLNRPPDGTGEK